MSKISSGLRNHRMWYTGSVLKNGKETAFLEVFLAFDATVPETSDEDEPESLD